MLMVKKLKMSKCFNVKINNVGNITQPLNENLKRMLKRIEDTLHNLIWYQ